MIFMAVDTDGIGYRFVMLVGKSSRLLWNIFLTIVFIITFMYGVILGKFGSQWIAIVICVLILGVITFLSLVDVKEEKHRFDNVRNSSGSVSRASSKKR